MAKGYPEIEELHRKGKAPRGADVLGPLAVRYPPPQAESDYPPRTESSRERPRGSMETYQDYTRQFRHTLDGMHSGNPMPGMHYDIGHKMAVGARRKNPMGIQHKHRKKA